MSAGSAQTLTVNAADSAIGGYEDAIGTQPRRAPCPPADSGAGVSARSARRDWFTFPVRGNRTFTIVTQALDETGAPTETKAMPAIGIWDAFDPVGATPAGAAPGLNGLATGETWLQCQPPRPMTWSKSASPTSAATAVPTTHMTAGCFTQTPSSLRICPSPAVP